MLDDSLNGVASWQAAACSLVSSLFITTCITSPYQSSSSFFFMYVCIACLVGLLLAIPANARRHGRG
ncbi:hypothetical protein V8C37DRAFT_385179 [Trichoderma ceciliae]